MKIRNKNIVIITVKMNNSDNHFFSLISYDTLEKVLNKKVEFWEDAYKNFYATSLTSTFSIKFNYFEDIERLIELEKNNEDAELIVAKKKLIDKLKEKINSLNPHLNSKAIELLNEVIEELKN